MSRTMLVRTQRQGSTRRNASALPVAVLASEAGRRGAGDPLYSAEGLVRIGNGITYWHHLNKAS
ncbi:MAG TPA: hypothetical protein VGF81_05705 [Solirubrobacteraceae bacterium]